MQKSTYLPVDCPAGTYGDDAGLSTCELKCEDGYYCPVGSTSAMPKSASRDSLARSKVGNPLKMFAILAVFALIS